jgi:hypothetical protein
MRAVRTNATVYKERASTAPAPSGPAPLTDTISYVAVVQKGRESTRLSGNTVTDLGEKLRPYLNEARERFNLRFYRKPQEGTSDQKKEPLTPSEIPPLMESIQKADI